MANSKPMIHICFIHIYTYIYIFILPCSWARCEILLMANSNQRLSMYYHLHKYAPRSPQLHQCVHLQNHNRPNFCGAVEKSCGWLLATDDMLQLARTSSHQPAAPQRLLTHPPPPAQFCLGYTQSIGNQWTIDRLYVIGYMLMYIYIYIMYIYIYMLISIYIYIY